MGSPAPQTAPTLPSSDDREVYGIFRGQIVAEDQLVNHRMTWLILVQTFLLVILAAVVSSSAAMQHIRNIWVFKWAMCAAGVITAITVWAGIRAADREIHDLKQQYEDIYGGAVPANLPPIVGHGRNHKLGRIPFILPFFCVLLWLVLGFIVR